MEEEHSSKEVMHRNKSKKIDNRSSKLKEFNNIFDADVSLNQTNDFAGGCTPYKKVAKLAEKRKDFKKPALELKKKSKRDVKKAENDGASLSSLKSVGEKAVDTMSELAKHTVTDGDEDQSRREDVVEGDVMRQHCVTCGNNVAQADYIKHLHICLKQYKHKLQKTIQIQESQGTMLILFTLKLENMILKIKHYLTIQILYMVQCTYTF